PLVGPLARVPGRGGRARSRQIRRSVLIPGDRTPPTPPPPPTTGSQFVVQSSSSSCDWSRSGRSSEVTRREKTACSTRRARRLLASLPGPPRSPLPPSRSSLSQTLSSLRLNLVSCQPSRFEAWAEVGTELMPLPSRFSIGLASARISSFWLGVSFTDPTVVSPTGSSGPTV